MPAAPATDTHVSPPRRLQPGPRPRPVRHRLHVQRQGQAPASPPRPSSNAPACSTPTPACAASPPFALGTNAPIIRPRRGRAVRGPRAACRAAPGPRASSGAGVPIFGSKQDVAVEKAICAKLRGRPRVGQQRHQLRLQPRTRPQPPGSSGTTTSMASPLPRPSSWGGDGALRLRGMVLLDEIRGRLARSSPQDFTRSTTSSTGPSPPPPRSAR